MSLKYQKKFACQSKNFLQNAKYKSGPTTTIKKIKTKNKISSERFISFCLQNWPQELIWHKLFLISIQKTQIHTIWICAC
jgi:hypothetical protein